MEPRDYIRGVYKKVYGTYPVKPSKVSKRVNGRSSKRGKKNR